MHRELVEQDESNGEHYSGIDQVGKLGEEERQRERNLRHGVAVKGFRYDRALCESGVLLSRNFLTLWSANASV